MDKYSNLKRWMADIEKLPSWQKTQEAVEKALLPNKESNQVRAAFRYTRDDKGLTEIYFYEAMTGSIHEPGDDTQEMSIHDGWSKADSFSVDREGFSIHDFQTQFPQDKWENENMVQEKFYPEIVEFLKHTLGAKRVLVFDHTIRTLKYAQKKLTEEKGTSQRAPVSLVHCDYTNESGPTRVRQLLPDEADDLLSRRVAFFNVWKPLHKVEENPLAMCDVTSSPHDDFFKVQTRRHDKDA